MTYRAIEGVPPSSAKRGLYQTETGDIYWVNSDADNPRSVRWLAKVGPMPVQAEPEPIPEEPNRNYNIDFVRSQLEAGETLEEGYLRLLERFEILMNDQRVRQLDAEEQADYQLLSRSLLVGG